MLLLVKKYHKCFNIPFQTLSLYIIEMKQNPCIAEISKIRPLNQWQQLKKVKIVLPMSEKSQHKQDKSDITIMMLYNKKV